MQKVLISGGAGFIGSHLCEAMLNLGWEVIALDNLYSGKLENIAKLAKALNVSIEELFKGFK